MNFNHPKRGGSTVIVRTTCAIIFLVFAFLWLRFFQADLLAVGQHVLSGGVTSYNSLVGAVLITLLLFLLQLVVYVLTRLKKRYHALTYWPSMLALAVLSDINTDIGSRQGWGSWLWAGALALLAWAAVVWLARKLQQLDDDKETGLFSRRTWVNLLLMAAMMIFVVSVANTNAVFHYRAHVESSLCRGQYDEALRTGRNSLETDAELTMLRTFALSKKGELGERLFQYQLAGTSATLLPTDGSAKTILLPADSIWRHLGARPANPMLPRRYLELLLRDSLATPAVPDYLLCAQLIDRDLDAFVRTLPQYYAIDGSLPRHYREALVLYTHLRSHPVLVYKDPVTDEDYDNLQELEKKYPDAQQRKGKVLERFRESYWWYYEYQEEP